MCLFVFEWFLKSTRELLVKNSEMIDHGTVISCPVRILICRLWDQTVLFLPYLEVFNSALHIPGKPYKSRPVKTVSVFMDALK